MATHLFRVTILFGFGVLTASASAQQLVLVENGVSRAPVILFEGAPPRTRQAAEELVAYIGQISGAECELVEGRPDPIPDHAVWVGYQPVLDELFPDLDFTRLMMECVPLMERVRESGGVDGEAVRRAAANWDKMEEIAEATSPHGFWFSVISSRMEGGYMGEMADHLGPPSQEFRERSGIVTGGQANAEILIAEDCPRSVRLAARELQAYVKKITGATLEIVTEPSGPRPATGEGRVTVFVGESRYAQRAGVTAAGLEHDAFRIVSGDGWLALVGDDDDFTPIEPWARSRSQWQNEKRQEWDAIAGGYWNNPVGQRLEVDYREDLDLWRYDRRGSLNAVYEFLRGLGVRWYMPGELGEIVPEFDTIELPEIDRTVEPEIEVRTMNFARFGRGVSTEDC